MGLLVAELLSESKSYFYTSTIVTVITDSYREGVGQILAS
jgi:hypothetical protein